MEKVQLGNTGLNVSRLGIGLSEIGSSDESVAKNVLINAFDSGINFFDTSSCYNRSEEFFGKVMSSNYNSRPLPSEILVHNDNYAIIYSPEKIEKTIEADIIPSWL